MDLRPSGLRGQEPVERFKPTTGALAGWSGLVLAVGAVIYVAVDLHTALGLQIGLAAAFGAALVWSTQVRPRVTAYPDSLLMLGSVRDVEVPYVAIDEVAMGQTLNIWVGRRRFVCVGIGKSIGYEMRQRVRSMGNNSQLGANRAYQFTGKADETDHRPIGMAYDAFVLSRITDLIAEARTRAGDTGTRPEVRTSYAVPELIALVGSGAALVLSIVLL